jgi:hypothetical protein
MVHTDEKTVSLTSELRAIDHLSDIRQTDLYSYNTS